ncbi:PA2817 family protein [Teredinibacter franksiae]|uniref:PA2817 family protein n=1 Tax=Teredinibacter franksiae TaxID=2761453 RepID=UPI001626923A|nr:PA2817 family protein [Teredinibacter franksiae]
MENTVSEYQKFHQQLVVNLLTQIRQLLPFTRTDDHEPSEQDTQFIEYFDKLSSDLNASEEGYPLGQWIITAIVARYPHITPLVARDLFWFFGGDCLHYLGDEEITKFQKLDESFHTQDSETETFVPYEEMREQIFNLQ